MIKHTVTVGEKGRLNFISITTILIETGFYPNPNDYTRLGYSFETRLTSTDGWLIFDAISKGLLLDTTDNSLFFGINGFNFTMEGTRLFLLDIATEPSNIFRNNLATNTFMIHTDVSVLLLADRTCPAGTDFYHV